MGASKFDKAHGQTQCYVGELVLTTSATTVVSFIWLYELICARRRCFDMRIVAYHLLTLDRLCARCTYSWWFNILYCVVLERIRGDSTYDVVSYLK